MSRTHGGRWADYLERYGTMPLDFSSNVSPLGMAETTRAAAVAALEHADRYPDPSCRELRRAIAAHHGLEPDVILAGNGAGDLIDRLALALQPRRALVTAPTFGEYRAAFERVGCTVGEYLLSRERDFAVDDGILAHIDPELDVLVLCEPNNPTGRTCDHALLLRIARRCDRTGTLLVVDECFCDFLDDPAEDTLLHGVAAHRVLVLRAFTKFYGMAGLRLGWCACADAGLLQKMADAGQPWPVSSVAQAAGVAALADKDYPERVRSLVHEERARMASALRALGCLVVPGEANYLLFYDETPRLAERLARRGVLVRECGDFTGLDERWYRVAVRAKAENDRLLCALEVERS